MGKIRVYQFAKLLKISNDDAVEMLRKHGVDVKSNLSSVDEVLVEKFQQKTVPAAKPPGASTKGSSAAKPATVPGAVLTTRASKPTSTAPLKKISTKAKPAQTQPLKPIVAGKARVVAPSTTGAVVKASREVTTKPVAAGSRP